MRFVWYPPSRPVLVLPFEEPLIKAVKTKPMKLGLGTSGGLPIIAIGKKGGKIVGYKSDGKPIYAGSVSAKKLSQQKKADAETATDIASWLNTLDIHTKIIGDQIGVSKKSGQLLNEYFGVAGKPMGSAHVYSVAQLKPHVGKALTPKEDDQLAYAAKMAAGDDEGIFPDLAKLVQISAGKYAGSHGNLLFQDPVGKKWIFKKEDPTIARAEEAAARLGRLIMGDKIPPVKVVTIKGKTGALIGEVPGEPLNESNHSNPPTIDLQKYAKQIAMHQVVDWLTSNHDGHAGNFLSSGDQLMGIDKGQAWKFFGKDQLTPDYSPNPSKPIYVKFWNAFKDGLISTDDVKQALGEALAKAKTISPEQFKSIVAPYVVTAGAHMGFDPHKRMKQMLARLEGLEGDFTKLWQMAGMDGDIPIPGEDNFETMSETVKEHTPLVMMEPAKEAVVTEKVSGWPQTKKKITINHPGAPPPEGWPQGYPGPGFSATMVYKKQTYTVHFESVDGHMKFDMFYPDGSTESFPSPAKASDSMKLYNDGLPLDMGATEKKKKGIAYPASTAFGLKAFKEELASVAGGADVHISVKDVQTLEEEKLVTPETKELSLVTMLGKESNGVIYEPSLLPNEVKEFLEGNEMKVPADWPAELAPGQAVKLTGTDQLPFLLSAKVGPTGEPEYWLWMAKEDETWAQAGPIGYETLDEQMHSPGFGVSTAKWTDITGWKKANTLPKAVDPVGSPPPVEVEANVTIPKDAAPTKGPLPENTSITMKKKFPWGKKEVLLHITTSTTSGNPVYSVAFPLESGDFATQDFDSLSSASDFVWLNQKGYDSIEDYKAKTGKKKVASGGGWKFWGVKPGQEPQLTAPPKEVIPGVTDPTLAAMAGVAPDPEGKLPGKPTKKDLEEWPVGTTFGWDLATTTSTAKYVIFEKNPKGWKMQFDNSTVPKLMTKVSTAIEKVTELWQSKKDTASGFLFVQGAGIDPGVAAIAGVTATVDPSPDNFETMPHITTETGAHNLLDSYPVGTKIEYSFDMGQSGLKHYEVTKTPAGWVEKEKGSTASATINSNLYMELVHASSGNKKVLVGKGLPKPKPKPKPQKTAEQKAAEDKAKAIQAWGKDHGPVTNPKALSVLSHFQKMATKDYGIENGNIWARVGEGGYLLLGSEHGFFPHLMQDEFKGKFETVETPLGNFWKVSIADLQKSLPGTESIKGPDGKEYPAGTTFKEKKTTFTKQVMLKQEPGFYKIKPHKTDPKSVVVKVSGTGDSNKAALMKMLLKWKVPFDGDSQGMPIVGGQNVLVFAKKADLEEVGKTETTTEADIPAQPPTFQAKGIPAVQGANGWQEVLDPSALKGVQGMTLPRMGKAIAMGKPGIFRDNHVKVRRVQGADGKVYTEVYGTLAQTKTLSAKKGWEKGTVNIPSAINIQTPLTNFGLHNYDAATGLSIEKPGTAPTYSETGMNGTTENGSSIAVHRGATSLKNMFRIRIEDGQDVQKELSAAFTKMNIKPKDALAPVDADTERVWKKWALVRSVLGPKGFQKELKDDAKQSWDEAWLDKNLEYIDNAQTKLDSMVLKETFQGHPNWVVMDDVQTYKDAGWKFAQRVDADYKSLYFQLSQGAGWASQKTKGQAGSFNMATSAGASASQDITSGGSDTIFFRAQNSWSGATASDGVIMHPRAFLRTDWRRYNSDAYGNITGKGHGSSAVAHAPGRYSQLSSTGTECVWQGGAPISDIMCVTVHSEDTKGKLKKLLQNDGITEINGVSLDDFILVGAGNLENRIHPSLRPGEEWTS